MKSKHYLLLVSFLCFGIYSFSQPTQDRAPLKEVLEEVTRAKGYRFNYASDTVEGIEVTPPDLEWGIEEILAYLSEKSGLVFSELPNNFFSVKRSISPFCGFLKDRNTGDPLPFATIQSNMESTISDENGYFELDFEGESSPMTIRFIGYRDWEEVVGRSSSSACRDFYMIPQQLQLAEIVLYDYLIRGIDQLDDGSYEIDFDRFTILPGLIETDVLQAVQAFPGIQSVNETVSDINIRGGTNDQNLILWDGIKMYQSGHFFGLISMFNPMITQHVSLRKNGSPVKLTDGVSGTISMETDEQVNRDFSGSLGVNFIDVSGFVDTPLGASSSIQVAARKAINDFVESPTYTEYFSRISQDTEVENNVGNVINSDQAFDFYDTSLRWLWKVSERDKVRLNFILAENELVFNENADIGNTPVSRESSLTQGTVAGGLQYERQWNDRISTELQIYNTDYTLRAINANIADDQRFLQENKVSETSARLQATMRLNEQWQWNSGYHFTETKVTNLDDVDDPVFRRLEGNVLRVKSGYTSLGYFSPDRGTRANVGLRVNYLDKFNRTILEPRMSFNQRISEGFNLEILGEFKHQNTSQVINFQNDFLGIEKRRWQLADEGEIPVITSKQGSAGLSFNRSGWLLNAVGYYKEVDGITAQSQGFQNQYEFTKAIGRYEAMGMDFLLRKQFADVSAWFSYSLLDSDYTFETLPERVFPNNYDITHALTLGVSYESDHLRLAAGWNWRTGKPATQPDEVQPVQNGEVNFLSSNSDRLNDYMRVDISALYAFVPAPGTNAQVGFSIWNLFDRENTVSRFYRVAGTGEARAFSQNSLGLTPNAVLRFNF
ncbi:TonB-dependent receptor [Muriicola jejuensis]|uniref:TonB-dependent receptor plug domain-containing protein n=1 Tax=Muriicola jejuensis TaxID=504488 RepID=A0A6P0UBJ8_9FLAO|nr:TonB-dependent receptor plug domain-containing protein [Muriicola jejuensis]NER10615.1 TonB-dependent receptor plug domain-containing protein [Muriicola jejuensis]